jgi:hypothetical protein
VSNGVLAVHPTTGCESKEITAMATQSHSEDRGGVKDPSHDGRLKENREAGRAKGTTQGSAARAQEHGNEFAGSSHSKQASDGQLVPYDWTLGTFCVESHMSKIPSNH